ncbi:DUF2231 domain-containing protein [Sphingomonas sp. ID1715]|uniref:DUF2231 domain-containing protein n=1 Tax=Sphingomonas sp. ID1715 TaxID=1656898 RepID=UPI001487FB88|nr:DUF2231 domain-containing protein [Sphingomonas sp. ID1715]NNM77517.1 DUF2231 domain-containing protein [Sphingomonas sp. ID1715]
MTQDHPRSTARIAGHPIHPMTVMFPVTLFIATLFCDILFATTGELFWATVGLLTLGLGILTAGIAAIFGLIDYFGDARVRALRAAHHHLIANLLVVLVEIVNWSWRFTGGPGAISPTGLILSALAVLLLGYSGWKGATLVYRHGVGVDSEGEARHSR